MMTWAPCPHGVRTRGKKTWGGTLVQGKFGKVDTASEQIMPKLGAAAEPIADIFSGFDPLQ